MKAFLTVLIAALLLSVSGYSQNHSKAKPINTKETVSTAKVGIAWDDNIYHILSCTHLKHINYSGIGNYSTVNLKDAQKNKDWTACKYCMPDDINNHILSSDVDNETVETQTPRKMHISFNLGVSATTADVYNSSNVMYGFGLSIGPVYLDWARNDAKGSGTEMKYTTRYTYKAKERLSVTFNGGYNIDIGERLVVTPLVSYSQLTNIYQDPVAFDTYYYENSVELIGAGLLVTYYVPNSSIAFSLGTSTAQTIKFQIAYGK